MLQREQVGDGDGQRQAETGAQAVAQHHGSRGEESLGDRGDRGGLGHHPVRGAGLRQPAAEHARPHRTGVGGRGVADDATGRTDGRRDGAAAQQLSADGQRRRVIGLTEDLDDVLAVAAPCDGPQFGQRGVEVRAADGAIGGVGNAQHGSTIAQHADQWLLHVAQKAAGVVGDPVGQPLEVVDHPHQGATARGERDRAEVGAEEALPQRVHRPRGLFGRRGALQRIGQRLHTRAACRRSSSWWRGGKTNNAAGTHTASAISQPSRRSAMGPTGVHAGSTKVSRVARWPAATISLSTPENVTTTPSTNITATLTHGWGATSVPSGDQNQSVESQTGVGEGTRRAVAGKVDQDQQRHRAEDGEQRRLRTTSDGEPDAGGDRNHDGRPPGAP